MGVFNLAVDSLFSNPYSKREFEQLSSKKGKKKVGVLAKRGDFVGGSSDFRQLLRKKKQCWINFLTQNWLGFKIRAIL